MKIQRRHVLQGLIAPVVVAGLNACGGGGSSGGGGTVGGGASSSSSSSSSSAASITAFSGGTEFRVNTQIVGFQGAPQIAGLINGNIMVTWTEDGAYRDSTIGDGSSDCINMRAFNPAGSALTNEVRVNTTTLGAQYNGDITALTGGGFVIVWRDNGPDPLDFTDSNIKAQIFDAAGAKNGGEISVNTQTSGNQVQAVVAGLSNGGFVVVWYDGAGSISVSNPSVKFQIFTAIGGKVGGEMLFNTGYSSDFSRPNVVGLTDGRFLISREYAAGATGIKQVVSQIFSSMGAKIGAEITVSTRGGGEPAGAGLSNGGFVVVWSGDASPLGDVGTSGVIAQRFDTNGNRMGVETLVNTRTADSQYSPRIASLKNGGYVIGWTDNSGDGSGSAVRGQVFTDTGTKFAAEFLVNVSTAGGQNAPYVTGLANGGFAMVWSDTQGLSGDPEDGIVARTFSPVLG